MTKKRFKLSMAALGLLAAFFMVLIALLLAPTLASANRDAGKHHHGGMPDTGSPHGGSGPQGFAENLNQPGHEHGDVFGAPFCVDDGVHPCTILGNTDDAFDGAGGYPGHYENGYGGGGNPQGGSPNGNNRYTPNFWSGGGHGGGAGGGGGGGAGAGGSQGGEKTGTDNSSNHDTDQSGPDDTIPGLKVTDFAPPGDDQPSPFVDPKFGDPNPEGGPQDGPKDEEPPITEVAVTEVPEPLTMSLFAVGLAGAFQLRRRSRKA